MTRLGGEEKRKAPESALGELQFRMPYFTAEPLDEWISAPLESTTAFPLACWAGAVSAAATMDATAATINSDSTTNPLCLFMVPVLLKVIAIARPTHPAPVFNGCQRIPVYTEKCPKNVAAGHRSSTLNRPSSSFACVRTKSANIVRRRSGPEHRSHSGSRCWRTER